MFRSRRQAPYMAMKDSCTTSSAVGTSPTRTTDIRTSERYSVVYIAMIAWSASDAARSGTEPGAAFPGGASAAYPERAEDMYGSAAVTSAWPTRRLTVSGAGAAIAGIGNLGIAGVLSD